MENKNVVDVARKINEKSLNNAKNDLCLIIPDEFKNVPEYEQIKKIIKNLNSYKNKQCFSHTSRICDIYKIDSVYGNLIVSSAKETKNDNIKYRDVGQFKIDYLSLNRPKIVTPSVLLIGLDLKIYDEKLLKALGSYISSLRLEIFKKPNAIKAISDIVDTDVIIKVTKEMCSDISSVYDYGLNIHNEDDEEFYENDDSFEDYSESILNFAEIEKASLACGLDATKIMYYDGNGNLLKSKNKKYQAVQILGYKKPDFVKQIEEMLDDWDNVYQETLAGNTSYYQSPYKSSDRNDSRENQR